ncbi:Hypothetical Protein FCC1311_039072 [Hondaea fermentalgiana]|uniref:Uncharacterized protein n=1 Tax=Hondaea fermentalgiana TaxID=2315210 RepID=A0A2R5GII5_9STRA|nr:Hypothetical Protein FCC1311_039072 [Hondaea fermentalgiana]|eukprot:GBG27684.1 Hypothetical Protein FCC1311_039072 [Hondaea fermentalgiana]
MSSPGRRARQLSSDLEDYLDEADEADVLALVADTERERNVNGDGDASLDLDLGHVLKVEANDVELSTSDLFTASDLENRRKGARETSREQSQHREIEEDIEDGLSSIGNRTDERKAEADSSFHVQELGASFNSLSHAHAELMRLSEGLQLKARLLAEQENNIASQRLHIEQAQLEIEDRRATLAQREAVMGERLAEEERMLQQDVQLAQQRLRDSAREELASAKDKLHTQRETLLHKLGRAQKLARQRAKQLSHAEDRIRLLTEKNRRLDARAADLELEMATQTNELDRVRAELDNTRKKFRVETWRRQKTQSQRQEEAASAEARRADETQHARARSSLEFAQDRQMLMTLADGLADALLSRNAPTESLSEDLFVHKLLPGLAHALHLASGPSAPSRVAGLQGGDVDAASGGDKAQGAQRERLLLLVMYCLQGVEMLQRQRGTDDANRSEEDRTRSSMVHRFASRLLKTVHVPVLGPDARTVGRSEMLSAQVVLGMHMLKKPLEPSALLSPLRVVCRGVATAEGCELMLRFPVSLEPALRVLYFTGHAAWRPCVREVVMLLLAISRKSEYQTKFLHRISRAIFFADACEAVLTTVQKLETHETDRAFTDCACEAASIIAVILQRLTRTESGVDFVRGAFRGCDLVGLLNECQRVTAALGARASDKDSLEFFQLNARAVEAALKVRLQREREQYEQASSSASSISSGEDR